jgi:putative ABC transport system permease protein
MSQSLRHVKRRRLRHGSQKKPRDEEKIAQQNHVAKETACGGRSWLRVELLTIVRAAWQRDARAVEQFESETRGGISLTETLLQDLRYGARTLFKNRGVTLAVILTLALGVGANASIFGVVEGVLLRPLPFRDASRVVGIRETLPTEPSIPVGYRTYTAWRDGLGAVFEGVAAASSWDFNLGGEGDVERVAGARVTSNYFDVMGARPLAGRGFLRGDDQPGAARVAVIDEGLWRRRFGGAQGVIGQSVRIDDDNYEIVGVMPSFAEQKATGWASVWIPLVVRNEARALANPFRYLTVNARLRDGVGMEQARAELERVMATLRQNFPDTHGKPYGVDVRRLQDFVVPRAARTALLVLLGVVAFVLLIACANVANLLLARAAAREREFAVRVALGASRGRIVRQLLTESLLLALAGALCGLVLAQLFIKLLANISPAFIPRLADVRLDAAVFLFALALAALTGLLFGLAPALAASKVDLNAVLKDGARGAGRSVRHGRLRNALVVAEVALSLTLLVGAGLMIRSYLRLNAVDAGFDTEHILTAELTLTAHGYDTRERRVGFFREAIERVRRLPGAQMVAAAQSLPLRGPILTDPVVVEGRTVPPRGQVPFVRENIVTPDYFRAMGMRFIKGRAFTEQETWETGGAIIVNESFARKFFAGEDALDKRVRLGEEKPSMTVVGVVGDALDDGFDGEPIEQMFYPYTNPSDPIPLSFMTLVVRTSVEPQTLAAPLRGVVRGIDASVPVSRVQTMRAIASRATSGARFNLLLTALFAVLALALASVGVYSVMSYAVSQRAHEIGVRMALGAQGADVVRMIVRQGMRLALLGVGVGVACALALTRLVSSLLFGVSATDPLTFASVALLLAVVALAACLIPARRATRIDPLAALRQE